MTSQQDLFGTVPAPELPEKKVRRGPLRDRLEQYFRDHRFSTFSTVELHAAFADDKLDSIRNAVKYLHRQRIIKSTGGIREEGMKKGSIYTYGDFVCLTLTIGK